MIQLNFPENLDVKVLLDYVSKRLDLNVLYDQSVGKKKVTIASPTKIPRSALMGLLQSVLKMSGLAIVDAEQEGWKKIVPNKDMFMTAEFETDLQRLRRAEGITIVTQVFDLKRVTVKTVESTIKPFLSKPGGNTYQLPDRNLIFVTDYADNLRRIAELIKMVDVPGEKAKIRFIPVKHLDAAALARQVTGLLQDKEKVAGAVGKYLRGKRLLSGDPRTNRIIMITSQGAGEEALQLIELLDHPTGDETRSYRLSHVSPDRVNKLVQTLLLDDLIKRRYKSTVDKEMGLLVVSAPPSIHERIKELVKDLDVPETDPQRSHLRFYKLKNTTAAEVLATIRAIGAGDKGIVALAAQQVPLPGPETEKFTGENAPPPALGEELPKPPAYKPSKKEGEDDKAGEPAPPAPPSRTVETRDAVVTADPNTNQIIVVAPPAVQRVYEQLITTLDKRRPQVMVEVILVTLDTSDGYSLGVELSRPDEDANAANTLVFSAFGLSTVDPATGALTLIPGSGFNGTLVRPDTISAVIRALADSGRSKVLSAPKLLVNDHATATINSVAEEPYTSVNASDTVSTTSFAGYASAGTTVTVTPHISEGDHLQLRYSISLNSFTGSGGGGIPPPRQTNSVNSEVTVPDAYTIVVGGLTRESFSETISKVPILGDIPLLGYLFSSRVVRNSQGTLFVFIRPIILRDDQFEDLKYLSAVDLELAELPSDFPESEPLLMQ